MANIIKNSPKIIVPSPVSTPPVYTHKNTLVIPPPTKPIKGKYNPVLPTQLNQVNNQATSYANDSYIIPKAEDLAIGLVNRYWQEPQIPTQTNTTLPRYKLTKNAVSIDQTLGPNNQWNDNINSGGVVNSMFVGRSIISAFTLNKALTNGNKYIGGENISQSLTLDRALITVSQKKNIVTTKIIGKNGTIKEYIGLDDYDVKIEGTLFSGRNGLYPIDKVKLLEEYCDKVRSPIYITCDYLFTIFGINYLVIQDYDIGMEEGSISQQKFTINAISDDFFDIDLNFNPYNS